MLPIGKARAFLAGPQLMTAGIGRLAGDEGMIDPALPGFGSEMRRCATFALSRRPARMHPIFEPITTRRHA